MSIARDLVGKFRVTVRRTFLTGGPNAGKKETYIKLFNDEDAATGFNKKARFHSTCQQGHPVKDVPMGVEQILAAN